MTSDEAIKELREYNTFVRDCGYPKLAKAQKLGIEALKRVEGWRKQFVDEMRVLLPGETEETK